MRPKPRSRKRLLLPLLGVALALLATELVLQGAAYAAWRARPAVASTHGAGPVVLCVGDSYTYGMGATDPRHSYPDRLQVYLRQALGRPVEVVNAGWPGHTSRNVLQKLQRQLDLHRPRLVCILVGVNDLGTDVKPLPRAAETAGDGREGFPFELRLGRLLRYAVQWLRGGPAYSHHRPAAGEQRELPFLGTWHDAGLSVQLIGDGRILSGSLPPMRWYLNGDRLMLEFPHRPPVDSDYRIENGRLSLALPGVQGRVDLEPGPGEDLRPRSRAEQELAAGRFRPALALFEQVIANDPDCDPARAGMVRCLVALDQRPRAEHIAHELAARARAGQRQATDPALRALVALGRLDRVVELAAELEDRGVPSGLWEVLCELSNRPERHRELQHALAAALDNPAIRGRLRARLLRVRYLALQETDPEASLAALIEAELIAPAVGYTVTGLHQTRYTDAMLEHCLDRLHLDATQRAHIRELRSRELERSQRAKSTLAHHVERIVARCRAAGATPVLLGYPFRLRDHSETLQAVAQRTAAAWVPLADAFERLLAHRRWEDLFVVDGHCNDQGYDEMARLAAEALAPMLR